MAYVENPCLFVFSDTFILPTIKTGTLSNFHMTSLADESNLYTQKSK